MQPVIEGAGRLVGDRYELVRELGRGGMGVVYLGRDLRLDMDVAIKFRGFSHSDATLWLKREFRAVAALRHPNLVELYELVAHDSACYFTMEYLPGHDPRRWVRRDSDLPLELMCSGETTQSLVVSDHERTELSGGDAIQVMPYQRQVPAVEIGRVRAVLAQLAEGLAFLHACGVIHRDVKPSNAIVVDGAVKLLDFGLALERRRQHEDLARESRVVGTAAYLAPEYVDRLEVSPALDVFALGVLAFELVTGNPPFGGALHVLRKLHSNVVIPRTAALNPEVPPELDDIIDRMLAFDPAHRPGAAEVAAALTGQLSRPRAARRAPRFVGRARELAHIGERVADPAARARLVLVTGPSGAGKTALIEEAIRRATTARPGEPEVDTPVWRGRCHERERLPYRAFDLIVDDLATQLAGDPQLARSIDHPAALCRVFPVLAPLIDPVVGDEAPARDLRVERERALFAMAQLFHHMVRAPRGVVMLDDLQWADRDSLELLAVLVETVDRPLTVLASWTIDGEPPPLLAALVDRLAGAAATVALPAMTDDDLARVISDVAPDAPVARIVAAARQAAGSPYLAELIGRELALADAADPAAGSAEARRLARLAEPTRAVAELAALAGGPAGFEQLRALAELPAGRLHSALRDLEDNRILRATPSPAGDAVYVFYHQRLREAASAAMAPALRRARHGQFAAWFERTSGDPGQLAYHWSEAGEPARAAAWAAAAGDRARDQLAWSIAADWYARALELRSSEDQDGKATAKLELRSSEDQDGETAAKLEQRSGEDQDGKATAKLEQRSGEDQDGEATAKLELRSSEDQDGKARAKLALGDGELRARRAECLFLGAHLASAADEFLVLARDHRDGDRWRVRAAEAYLKLGEIDRGLGVLDDVLERRGRRRSTSRAVSVLRAAAVGVRWLASPPPARPDPVDPVLAAAYRVIASFLSTPHPIEALEYVLRGIALAERTADRAAHSQGMAMLAAYLAAASLGRFGDRALARAGQLAAQSGAPYSQMVAAGCTGIVAMLRGDWLAMRAAHEAGHQICERLGLDRSWEASFLRSYWALGEHYAGEPARALELLDELSSPARITDDLFARAMLGSYRGRALVLAGDLTAARRLARELERAPAARHGMASIYRQVFAAELALAEHAWPRAAALADQLAASARAQWLTVMPAVSAMIDVIAATAALGAASAGDRTAAARALATARRLHRRGRSSFYAVTALRLWGQAEALLGHDRRARAVLARAGEAAGRRGGKLERLAIAALTGARIEPGALAAAVTWSTGGVVG